jgi:sugar diacid utilization regulator
MMTDLEFIRNYFAKNLAVDSFQIWMYTEQNKQWHLIFECNVTNPVPPAFIPFQNASESRLWKQSNPTYLSFLYPEKYRIVVKMENDTFLKDEVLQNIYFMFFPFYTQEIVRTKELALEKLIDGVQDISSSLNLDELLSRILDNLAQMIPGCDTSSLWLYDSSINRLVCRAYRGWKEDIKKVQFKIGEGVIGNVFLEGKTKIYNYKDGMNAMKGLSKENSHYLWKGFHHRRIKITVNLPIKVRGETTGVVAIQQTNEESILKEWDLKLLKGLSGQIAIAIGNARLFTEVSQTNQLLMKRDNIHKKLIYISLLNMGLLAIMEELNKELEFPILFVDMVEESIYPVKDHGTLTFSFDELNKLLINQQEPYYLNGIGLEKKPFYHHPIILENVNIGFLVAEVNRPLTQLELITIEQGALVLALEMVKRQSLTELNYKKFHKFFTDLRQNNESKKLYTEGLRFGIDLNGYLAVICLEVTGSKDVKEIMLLVQRLSSKIQQQFQNYSKLVYGYNNQVTVLFSLPETWQFSKVLEQLNAIINQWGNLNNTTLAAGVGTLNKGISTIDKSYNEAKKALTFQISRNANGLIQYLDIGINRLFLNQPLEEVNSFLNEIFSPLRSKKVQNIELEKTLTTYIRLNRSANLTATQLHIHPNTLYQRLKKIEELLKISFDEPQDMLKIHLACHLLETFEKDHKK